jgi:hypothetical protein
MCANSTGRAKTFFSASDAAVSQEVADGKISIQSAYALNTRHNFGLQMVHIPVISINGHHLTECKSVRNKITVSEGAFSSLWMVKLQLREGKAMGSGLFWGYRAGWDS